MNMCMPDLTGQLQLNASLDQYLVGITESGPRGQTRFSAPNMFMLDLTDAISDCDSVKVDWMGATPWTVPKGGSPQLLQVGDVDANGKPYVDALHPHYLFSNLTFAEIHCLGSKGDKTITLSFAPRGEATAGPTPYMDRPSAEGNWAAPLAHHLQDVFHSMSTVLAARFAAGKWSIEGSLYSGHEQVPTAIDLGLHKLDSGGVRVERQLNNHVSVGGSFASTLDAPPGAQAERQNAIGAWVMTDNHWRTKSLSTSTIYGQSSEDKVRLNSFLNELLFRFGKDEKNHVFSRFEVLQRTPEQLELQVTGDAKHPEWVKDLTLGYEREILKGKSSALYLGGSYTKSFVPTDFRATYGGNPNSAEIHLRLQLRKSKSWEVEAPVPEVVRARYSWIHLNVILQKCAGCHTTTQGDGDGLPAANFDSYDTLRKVVTPGDPDGSPIYQVVRDHVMPRVMDGQTKPNYLTDIELSALRDWIKGGALKD
jgi:hypothetical protein